MLWVIIFFLGSLFFPLAQPLSLANRRDAEGVCSFYPQYISSFKQLEGCKKVFGHLYFTKYVAQQDLDLDIIEVQSCVVAQDTNLKTLSFINATSSICKDGDTYNGEHSIIGNKELCDVALERKFGEGVEDNCVAIQIEQEDSEEAENLCDFSRGLPEPPGPEGWNGRSQPVIMNLCQPKKKKSLPPQTQKFIEPFAGRVCTKGEKGSPSIKFYYDHQEDRYFPFKHTGCGGFGGMLVVDQYKYTPGQPKSCPGNLPRTRKFTPMISDYRYDINQHPIPTCPDGTSQYIDNDSCCDSKAVNKAREELRAPMCATHGLTQVYYFGRNCSHNFCPTRAYCIQGEYYAYCCKHSSSGGEEEPIPSAPRTPSNLPPGTNKASPCLTENSTQVSNDLLIMVDGGKNLGGKTAFNEAKDLAIKIIEAINSSIVWENGHNTTYLGTRLALNSLTQLNSGSLLQPWHSPPEMVTSQLKNLPQIQKLSTRYAHALGSLVDRQKSLFLVNNTDGFEYQNSRKTAQRILIIVSNSLPIDLDKMKAIDLTELDIHPIFVAYKMDRSSLDSLKVLEKSVSGWSVLSAYDSSNQTIGKFVDEYFLSSEKTCANIFPEKPSPINPQRADFLQVPKNYKLVKATTENWKPEPQTARYCNYQKKTWDFKGLTGKTCFTLFYELQPEKDFLRFFVLENGKEREEIAAFTGLDVSGSTIKTTGDIRVKFSTDGSDVRGGFHLKYGPC